MVRFACVTTLVLGVKLGIVWSLGPVLNPYVAYFITHLAIFIVSYVLHSKVTFNSALGWKKAGVYLKAVIGIKILDYLIFSVALVYFEINSLVAVLAATALITILRFMFARKALSA
nr:GtrA family protein [Pelagicoccus albus]